MAKANQTACVSCDRTLPSINFITKEDCNEILRNKLERNDFELINYELVPVKSTMGFLGDYYKLKIHYKINEYDHIIHCFAKCIATANDYVKNVSLICFKKEEFIYHTYIPLLTSLGFKNLTNFAPDCYFSKSNAVLVMKDLSSDGFTCSTLSNPAKEEWILSALKQVAKFHATSILCEQQLSKQAGRNVTLMEIYGEYFQETNFAFDKPYGTCMTLGVNFIYYYFVDKLEHIPGSLSREDFKKKLQVYTDKVFSDLRVSTKYRNVICHRDLWASNILMKKKEKGDTSLPECVFIDYQLIKYCPPAIDVLFLFYMNTERKTRNNCMLRYLKVYYNHLDEILKKYKIELDDIFCFNSFMKSCEDLKSTSICQSLAYLQVMFLPEDILAAITNSEERSSKYYCRDRRQILDTAWASEPFRKRVTELLEELYKICDV